jgi:cell pole-organizing protein PopZ
MTQPAKVQEPSMEEILASIRRIIADDEAKPPAAEKPLAPAAVPAPAPVPPKQEKPALAPKPPVANDIPPPKAAPPPAAAKPAAPPAPPPPAPAPAPAAKNSQDDIDALLNGLDDVTTEEEIRPAPQAEPEPEPEADVFELTDDMAVSSVASPAQTSFQKVEPEDDIEFTETAASRAMQRPPAYAPSPAAAFEMPAGPPSPPILSQTTITAVESAFNSLAHTVLSNNARTLEDLVKEMLRPMLKSWLDDNLPGLVERIVKAEIERVSRGR